MRRDAPRARLRVARTALLCSTLALPCAAATPGGARLVGLEQAKLLPGDTAPGDQFGASIAADVWVVVGAPQDDDGGIGSGSAYVFTANTGSGAGGYVLLGKLHASDALAGAGFGVQVATDGNVIAIAAKGAIYVFESIAKQYVEVAKLTAPDPGELDFGKSLAISGDRIAVGGAYGAYLYRREGQGFARYLTIDGGDGGTSLFGASVALDGDTLFVGAPQFGGERQGSARAYELSGDQNTLKGKLEPVDRQPDDQFGKAVAVSGSTAVVCAATGFGAPPSGYAVVYVKGGDGFWQEQQRIDPARVTDDFSGPVDVLGDAVMLGTKGAFGHAVIFAPQAGVWVESARLNATGAGSDDQPGAAVAIDASPAGGYLLYAGAPGDDTGGASSGAAYWFFAETFDVKVPVDLPSEGKLIAGGDAEGDRFGGAVAISGTTLAVGAHGDDEQGTASGAVYTYDLDGVAWQPQGKMVALGRPGTGFGSAVALAGNWLAVGAPDDAIEPTAHGALHLFERTASAWESRSMIQIYEPGAQQHFGQALAATGTTLVVGAPGRLEGNTPTGIAYVYELGATEWLQTAELLPEALPQGADLGVAVATDGELALLGAPGEDNLEGAAYVFARSASGWVEDGRIVASQREGKSGYAEAVATQAGLVVVGASSEDGASRDSGAVYLYANEGGAWVETAKLLPDLPDDNEQFGSRVALDGDLLAVAARGRQAVQLYRRTTGVWARDSLVAPGDATGNTLFGSAAVLSASTLVVGDEGDDDRGDASGSAYVFSLRSTFGDCKDDATFVAEGGQEVSCAPYACASGACAERCASALDCAPGFACSSTATCEERRSFEVAGITCGAAGGVPPGGRMLGGVLAAALSFGLRRRLQACKRSTVTGRTAPTRPDRGSSRSGCSLQARRTSRPIRS